MGNRMQKTKKNPSRRLIQFVTDRFGHDFRYAIDATKIPKELGWVPKHSFKKAFAPTLDWYGNHFDWVNAVRSGRYRKWIQMNYQSR